MPQAATAGAAAMAEQRGIDQPHHPQGLFGHLRRVLCLDDVAAHRKFPQRTGSGRRLRAGFSSSTLQPSTGIEPRDSNSMIRANLPGSRAWSARRAAMNPNQFSAFMQPPR
jgi:hypothetical protein